MAGRSRIAIGVVPARVDLDGRDYLDKVGLSTAEFYRRNDEGIYEPVEIADDGRFASAVLPGFWLNVDWLRQDPLPFVMEALADIFSSDDRFPPELGRLYRQLADLNR